MFLLYVHSVHVLFPLFDRPVCSPDSAMRLNCMSSATNRYITQLLLCITAVSRGLWHAFHVLADTVIQTASEHIRNLTKGHILSI